MAPEVILRSSGYGKPADWWSLGIFTFDLLTGRSPFHSNQGKAATKERILRGKFPTPKILTPEAGDFIRRLLRKAVPKRLGTQGTFLIFKIDLEGEFPCEMRFGRFRPKSGKSVFISPQKNKVEIELRFFCES